MIETVAFDWRFGTIEVPAADRYIREALEVTGEYSGAEIDLYQQLLRPGDVAVDVGANIGVFSIAMALAVGPTGRILSFEPQPPVYEILQRNLVRHGLENVEADRAIVSSAEGSGEFADVQNIPEGTRLNFGSIHLGAKVRGEYGRMAPTPVRSIDGLNLDRCALIKIDVEGAEEAVLAGAPTTIARCRPILAIECDKPNATHPWVDGMLDADYRLWRFRGKNLRIPNPKNAPIDGLDNFVTIMAVAVPAERDIALADTRWSRVQSIDSRATLEALSRRITVGKS